MVISNRFYRNRLQEWVIRIFIITIKTTIFIYFIITFITIILFITTTFISTTPISTINIIITTTLTFTAISTTTVSFYSMGELNKQFNYKYSSKASIYTQRR